MKTLVNKDNPVVRITAPEIQVRSDSYYFLINENYGFIIPKARWTLVEEEPKNIPKWKKVIDDTKLPTNAIVRYESDKNLQIENAISAQDVSRILGFRKPIAYYLTPDDLNKLPKEEE